MKSTSKKVLSIILTLAIFATTLVIMPFSTFAATSLTSSATPVTLESYGLSFWADAENVLTQDKISSFSSDKLSTLGGIKPYKISSTSTAYYLFLPSTADTSNLKFWFDGTASLDGETLTSGQATDALASINEGGTSMSTTLVLNGTSYSLNCYKSGDIATIYVDTTSGSMSSVYSDDDHETSEAGSIMVVQPDGTVDYNGEMTKIQGRGNGTWSSSNAKNPFNVKLATSTSLLGMSAAKKWVLLANSQDSGGDSTLIKDQLTYDFSKYIGVKYQPTCKPADLYINQQYYGSYQLSEKKLNHQDLM